MRKKMKGAGGWQWSQNNIEETALKINKLGNNLSLANNIYWINNTFTRDRTNK